MARQLFVPFTEWRPILQAVKSLSPDFVFDGVDLLASLSKLSSLLSMCKDSDTGDIHFHLTLVHNTLIISNEGRMPENDTMLTKVHRLNSVGNDFEEAFTEWPQGLEDSDSHVRVLQYDLGHLNCVISAGVDACLGKSVSTQDTQPTGESTFTGSRLMISRGFNTDSPVAEIKASCDIWPRTLVQLWFSRADAFIGGDVTPERKYILVNKIEIKDTADLCDEWETDEENQTALRRLTALISQLREIVRGTKDKQCYIIREGTWPHLSNQLHVFTVENGEAPGFRNDVGKYWRGGPE